MKLIDTLKELFVKLSTYRKAVEDVEAKIKSALGSEGEKKASKKVVKNKKKIHGSK